MTQLGQDIATNDDALAAIVVPGRYFTEALRPDLSPRTLYALGQPGVHLSVDDLVALNLISEGQRPDADTVNGWSQVHLGTVLDFYAKPLPRRQVSALLAGVDPNRQIALASLSPLAEAGNPSAVAAMEQLRDANAIPRRQPVLTITAAEAIALGFGQHEVSDLPTADMRTLAVSARIVATWAEVERLERRSEAARMEAARTAAEVDIPERVDLTTFEPDTVQWVVGGLIARAAVLGLFAERKAGKSHLVRELIRSALDGERFLGKFPVHLADDAEVVLFDTEMPLNTLHGQYHRSGVKNLHRLNLRALRGAERSLDARVDAVRTRWRQQIKPGSLIIVDCLYSLFGALGVSENSDEVVGVLAGLRTLATECEAAGLVIVHHLGKDVDKGARGHSSIEGFPDAIARIELDGPLSSTTPRTFTAFGRDVSVDAGVLILGDDDHLTLGGNPLAERRSARRNSDDEAVRKLIGQHPGLSVRLLYGLPIEARGKLSRDRIREGVARLEQAGSVVNKGTAAAPEWHAIAAPDPFTVPLVAGG
ncbi:AAA family ATPase [Mycobacterium sp. BMJ-28]